MPMIDPARALQRLDSLKQLRSTFDNHWEEVRKITFPTAAEFTTRAIRGAKLHKDVYDGSAEMASETLAAAFFGMATNPATKWLGLVPENMALMEADGVAGWMEQATQAMLAMFNSPRTNFATQQFLKLQNFVSFGTGPQFIAELPGGVPLFQTAALAECFIAEGPEDRVDTVYRLYTRTARQLFDRFGGRLDADTIKKADDPKRQDDSIECLHVVEPRPDADREPGRIDVRNMPWREAFITVEKKHLVAESGFTEFPWVVPRMNPRPGEVYGRGRGMTALADAKMLQRSMKSTIRASEKSTDPPIQIPDDGVMGPIRMTAAGINVIRADLLARGGIRAIDTRADPRGGEDFNQRIRERIDRAHWLPILEAFTDPKMTATQIIKLDEQTLRFIGPMLGRLQLEDLAPMIDRCFPIMLRGGRFARPPRALEGQRVGVEFVSPIAKAQRLEEARGLAETLDLLGPLLQDREDILDNLDTDKAFRGVANLRGVPVDWLRSLRDRSAIRAARNQAAAQAAQSQAFQGEVPAAAKGLKALGDAGMLPGGGQPANENRQAA